MVKQIRLPGEKDSSGFEEIHFDKNSGDLWHSYSSFESTNDTEGEKTTQQSGECSVIPDFENEFHLSKHFYLLHFT